MNLNEHSFGLVICFLGITLLACVGGAIGLTATHSDVPDLLKELAVGSIGGLSGLLARTPNQPPPAVPDEPDAG